MKIAILVVVLGIMAVWVAAGSRVDSGTPEFDEQVIRVGRSPFPIAIADVNHDGKLDIIVGNMDDGTVSVLLGRPRPLHAGSRIAIPLRRESQRHRCGGHE